MIIYEDGDRDDGDGDINGNPLNCIESRLMTRVAAALVLLVAACPTEELDFEILECGPLDGNPERELPPWPLEQDDAPSEGGPQLDTAEFEYVDVDGDGCLRAAIVRLSGTDDGDTTAESIRASIIVFPSGSDGLDVLSVDGDVDFEGDGATFSADVPICVEETSRLRIGMYIHIEDSQGNGSNAICARTFAKPGVVPEDATGGP